MSTKIYNGFLLNNAKTLEDALLFSNSIRDDFEQMANEIWISNIIRIATKEYDYSTYKGNIEKNKSFIFSAFRILAEDERKSIATKQSSLSNVEMELCYFPIKLKNKKRIVGIYFFGNRDMQNKFTALPEISEFAYYDNSDMPSDISLKEWNTRKKIWENIFPSEKDLSIAERMFTNIIVRPGVRYIAFDEMNVYYEKYQISFDERLKLLSNSILMDEEKFKISDIWTDVFKEKKEKLMNELSLIIKKDITIDDLRNKENI